jgi:hypothetical protein
MMFVYIKGKVDLSSTNFRKFQKALRKRGAAIEGSLYEAGGQAMQSCFDKVKQGSGNENILKHFQHPPV